MDGHTDGNKIADSLGSKLVLFYSIYSSKSSDGLIAVGHSVGSILVIHAFPLVVGKVLDIDGSVDDWLQGVDEHEHGDNWENQTYPVTGETHIQEPIAFVRGPCLPKSLACNILCEGSLSLAETLNVQVDSCSHFCLDLESLDHLDQLGLLLVGGGVLGSNLSQILP